MPHRKNFKIPENSGNFSSIPNTSIPHFSSGNLQCLVGEGKGFVGEWDIFCRMRVH
jgi:hypothetical protein